MVNALSGLCYDAFRKGTCSYLQVPFYFDILNGGDALEAPLFALPEKGAAKGSGHSPLALRSVLANPPIKTRTTQRS